VKIENPVTISILTEVKRRILAEPLQFYMDYWFSSKFLLDASLYLRLVPNCGTTACIAGHICCVAKNMNPAEARKVINAFDIPTFAIETACLTMGEGRALFLVSNWPETFREGYHELTPKGQAQRAANRIDYFLETGE
jgi:hypothetical protein